MEAKLIKNALPYGYFLYNEKGDLIASTIKGYNKQPLSLKNCQAIECGYDLDELANKHIKEWDYENTLGKGQSLLAHDNFIMGFQKSLELMGDKKFSEEQMFKMFIYGHALTNAIKLKVVEDKPMGDIFNDFIQSLQQTEWDVQIIEECLDKNCDGINRKGECITTGKPKLDADGCLILKRI